MAHRCRGGAEAYGAPDPSLLPSCSPTAACPWQARSNGWRLSGAEGVRCSRGLAGSPCSMAVFRLRRASVCNGGECVSR
jgi:hypothetical protein